MIIGGWIHNFSRNCRCMVVKQKVLLFKTAINRIIAAIAQVARFLGRSDRRQFDRQCDSPNNYNNVRPRYNSILARLAPT